MEWSRDGEQEQKAAAAAPPPAPAPAAERSERKNSYYRLLLRCPLAVEETKKKLRRKIE